MNNQRHQRAATLRDNLRLADLYEATRRQPRPTTTPGLPPGFYESPAWLRLRYAILTHYGPTCMACGATSAEGAAIQVDHIKPTSRFPELALDADNLQVLCSTCNLGKSNRDETDWRKPAGTPPATGTPRPPGGKNDNT